MSDTIKCSLCSKNVTRDMSEFGYRPVWLSVRSPSGRRCDRWVCGQCLVAIDAALSDACDPGCPHCHSPVSRDEDGSGLYPWHCKNCERIWPDDAVLA
jgi:endogenous inhibitor of DNA gyrase (YacG/DUF329 family)